MQALLESAPSAEPLTRCMGQLELGPLLGARPGVIWKLAQAAARLRTGGQKLTKQLRLAVEEVASDSGAAPPTDADGKAAVFVRGVLRQGAREDEGSGEGGVAVGAVGCKLAQSVFALPRAQSEPLLVSLAALSPAQLITVARHPHGSRTLEAACATIVSAAPATGGGKGGKGDSGKGKGKGKGKGGEGEGKGGGGAAGDAGGAGGAGPGAKLLQRLWQVTPTVAPTTFIYELTD